MAAEPKSIEQVRADLDAEDYFVVKATIKGEVNELAFRYLTLKEFKMLMTMMKQNELDASIQMAKITCLTHTAAQLDVLFDARLGIVTTVTSTLTARMNDGVELEKKELV